MPPDVQPARRHVGGVRRHRLLVGEQGRGVDERDMGERLGEVPHLPLSHMVVLLCEEAEVVPEGQQPFEHRARIVLPADEVQAVGQPERAGEECALPAVQPVDRPLVRGAVTEHETVFDELTLDRLDRPDHARIRRRQEPGVGDHEKARIERAGAVVLGERVLVRVVALLVDLLADVVPHAAPRVDRTFELGPILHGPHRPVHGDPGHDLGVREVAARAAHLPEAVVRLAPAVLQELDQLRLEVPDRTGVHPARARS